MIFGFFSKSALLPVRAAAIVILGAVSVLSAAVPVGAFELFGYTFFEDSTEKQDADVIDPVKYEVKLEITGGNDDLRDTLESNSVLIRQQKVPTSGTVGLISRAQDDRTRLIAALYEMGHYGGVVGISIAGRQVDRIGLTETLSRGKEPVAVRITVDPGPVFHFGKVVLHPLSGKVDALAVATEAGLVHGEVARSTIVLDAETALQAAWSEVGHPFPKITARRVIADHGSETIDVSLSLDPGPEAVFGDVTVEGAEQIDAAFVARHADIPVGEIYDSRDLERARTNLRRLEALGGVVIRPAERLAPGGRLPIVIEITERKRHIIGGGVIFSTTEGAEVQAYWKHRNLLGKSETLRIDGAIGRIEIGRAHV